jgi:hypothetical protein
MRKDDGLTASDNTYGLGADGIRAGFLGIAGRCLKGRLCEKGTVCGSIDPLPIRERSIVATSITQYEGLTAGAVFVSRFVSWRTAFSWRARVEQNEHKSTVWLKYG